METRITETTTTPYGREPIASTAANSSAVCWGAIFAGAAAAAVLSLILLLLGTGLGMSSVSPWSNEGISGTTFGVSTILWITITSLVASAFGGYLAGRLRARWVDTKVDEIYFRDTAHGFLAWAVSTLITATLLTSVVSSMVSGAAQAGATIAGGAAATATAATVAAGNKMDSESKDMVSNSMSYFVDSLYRNNNSTPAVATSPTQPMDTPAPASNEAKAEVARIFATAIVNDNLPAEDVKYVGQVIAQQTNLSQAEAEQRVANTYQTIQTKLNDAKKATREAADKARKTTAYGSLWLFISLLISAFVASWTATCGGRQRDF